MASHPAAAPPLVERVAALPDAPGVYLFKDARGALLYVGKAVSLRKRVASYFRLHGTAAPLAPRIAHLMKQVVDLEVRPAASEAEALLIEAQLIRERRPRYNVSFRDDKSYPMLKLTREPFPRLVLTRRRQADGAEYFGPFTDAGLMHEAVRFLRRVFPLRTCAAMPTAPCLEYHLGQCLAPCAGYVSEAQYRRLAQDLAAFLRGERAQLLKELARRMEQAARDRRFEEAARIRNQIQALSSVIAARRSSSAAGPLEQLQQALRLPKLPRRIEAFDISNLFGRFAVGSMVVFVDAQPRKAHYRRFRIKTVQGIDDYRMMREVIRRRYSGTLAARLPPFDPAQGGVPSNVEGLPLPDLVLIDGGKGQLNAARDELAALTLSLPVIGLAKRFEQIFLPGEPEPILLLPSSPVLHLIQRLRDEAHRFAIAYYRLLHGQTVADSALHQIRGIGPKKAARLLAHFGSTSRLAQAAPAAVARVAGVSRAVAETVLERLGRPRIRTFRMP